MEGLLDGSKLLTTASVGLLVFLSLSFVISLIKYGHSKTITKILMYIILSILGISFLLLEIIFVISIPFRRIFLKQKGAMDPEEAAKLANGKNVSQEDIIKYRKVVIFDGVCVLCNRAGRFCVSHLDDPNLVSFLPYQDALSNPHASLNRIQQEFREFSPEELQNKIFVISGNNLFEASDAIFEICSWMKFPYPIVTLARIIPKFIRDACYMIVANNRYEVFGTQPLEQNFAKMLCPYLMIRKFVEPQANDDDDDDDDNKEEPKKDN